MIFISIIDTCIKDNLEITASIKAPILNKSTLLLKLMACIYYTLYFGKNKAKNQALIELDSKVRAITLVYAK